MPRFLCEGEIRNKNRAVALTAAIETSWHALGKQSSLRERSSFTVLFAVFYPKIAFVFLFSDRSITMVS